MMTTLEKLRRPTTSRDLQLLAVSVRTHADMLDEESLSTPHIDYEMAQSIASALCSIIDDVADLTPDQRSSVAAVARYFVLTEDEASDLDVDGLIDDASAVRGLCSELDRDDLAAGL